MIPQIPATWRVTLTGAEGGVVDLYVIATNSAVAADMVEPVLSRYWKVTAVQLHGPATDLTIRTFPYGKGTP